MINVISLAVNFPNEIAAAKSVIVQVFSGMGGNSFIADASLQKHGPIEAVEEVVISRCKMAFGKAHSASLQGNHACVQYPGRLPESDKATSSDGSALPDACLHERKLGPSILSSD